MDALTREGFRGRQMAFHLAGETYRTQKEANQDKREFQQKRRKEKKVAYRRIGRDENEAGPSNTSLSDDEPLVKYEADTNGLYSLLGEDDGDGEGARIVRTNLRGLAEKWGSRLRIRCTDDEIYFRLTGSHQKVTSAPYEYGES